MTVRLTASLYCTGCYEHWEPLHTQPQTYNNEADIRAAAALTGWIVRHGTSDYCPDCLTPPVQPDPPLSGDVGRSLFESLPVIGVRRGGVDFSTRCWTKSGLRPTEVSPHTCGLVPGHDGAHECNHCQHEFVA